MTQLSQALKKSRRGRKGAKVLYFGKLRDSVIASSLREQPASHRLEHAEKATHF